MSKFEVNAVQFDGDGVISIVYMNTEEALRREGTVFRTHTVSVAPGNGPLYSEARDILEAVRELLESLEQVYRNESAFLPEEQEPEDEDDLGMGF